MLPHYSEVERLEKLACYQILDTAPEPGFDSITAMAAHIFEVPIAIISLVDADRQWFKSKVGLDVAETPRSMSICAYALLQEDVFIIPNTLQDPRFAQSPLVTGDPHIRFYAGAPLITPDGFVLGTLCIIDHQPRILTSSQKKVLRALSQQVVTQLELRQKIKDLTLETNLRQQVESNNRTLIALKQHLENLVQDRTIQLQTANESLEEKVKERTAELLASMDHLKQTQAKLLDREDHLQYTAYHDPLTGLPNRRFFLEQLRNAIQMGLHNSDYRFAVLFIDLDNFKIVNDSLGHLVGDQLLKAVVGRLQQATQHQNCLLARLSGDEFVLLQTHIESLSSVATVANQMLQQLVVPFYLANRDIVVSASIGIAQSDQRYSQPEDVLRDADIAMYQAKRQGKRRFAVFNAAMQTQAIERLNLEEGLRHAIARQELSLKYQPIFSLDTGKVSGFEALIRWQHPQQGWIHPEKYIQVAEEIGLIEEMGAWVLQTACQQLKEWQVLGGTAAQLTINVNVSATQLKHPEFSHTIQHILKQTGLGSRFLKLEITESAVLEASSATIERLNQLKKTGVQICIDDFGTGYSSLSRLHELPIDILKIDRAFIQQMGFKQKGKAMVKTIVTLAHSFGMDVVAEGIETSRQLKILQKLGCLQGQGYLFAKPLSSEDALELVKMVARTFHQ